MNEGRATASARLSSVASGAAAAVRYLAIAIGFTLPISTASDNVLLSLLLVCWLASGRWREKYAMIRANPVALAALALLALLLLGLAWSQGPLPDGLLYLRKYTSLLLIPILVTVFTDLDDRRRGLLALAAAIALTLVLSLALAAGALPTGGVITGVPSDPTVFKKHITQNVFMAFGCLLFVQFARGAKSRNLRLLWAAFAGLAAFDVLFLVHGRTGYLVLAALVLLLLFERLRWRGLVAAAVLVIVGFASAYEFSDGFRSRISRAESEAEQWQPDVATETSVGIRLEFYRNTLRIIERHPWLGVGTGGFASAYAERVQGTGMQPTYNPHNQYLLTTAQLGMVGLALLMLVFVQQWRCARRLPGEMDRTLARGLVLTYVIASLFSSPLIDHAESLLFAWLSGLLFAALPPAFAAPEKSA
jgi:O-antigen ligase